MRICSFQRVLFFLALLLFCPRRVTAQSIQISSITFEGNQIIDSIRLKNQLRACREGGFFHPEALKYDLQQMQRFYRDEGFLKAVIGAPEVELRAAEGRGQSAVIRIPVSEGPLYSVGEIAVMDAQLFPAATILNMCPLQKGQPYSRRLIGEWRDKIAEAYQTLGYIRFESTVQEEVRDSSHVINCSLLCKEGKSYSVGKISVVGDDSIDRADFRRHILVSEGSPYSPELIPLTLQFLNQRGIYKPILLSDVETRIDDARAVVDLIFHVVRPKK